MKPQALLVFVALAAAPLFGATCDNDALIIDERATGIDYRGCWQVTYNVSEPFPAEGLLSRLADQFAKQGFAKLDYDAFAPDREVPVLTWAKDRIENEKIDIEIDQWLGWFKNDEETRVQLFIRYFDRTRGGASHDLALVTISAISPDQWETRPREQLSN